MPRDITVLFVHGINVSQFDYAAEFLRKVLRRLPRPLRHHVNARTVFWAEVVRDRSLGYMNKAMSTTGIVDNRWRNLVVVGLGDAAAYQKTHNREGSAYFGIQHKIWMKLNEADRGKDPDQPLVMIGHSLGCHILSSYCWDINRIKQLRDEELKAWNDPAVDELAAELKRASAFCRLDTLAGIVTMGSNIPLFTFTFGPDRVFPITQASARGQSPAFPGRSLSPKQVAIAKWLNFYSPNDLLGYPLKPLNSYYLDDARIQDIAVRSEGALRSVFLPSLLNAYAAHLGYWTNPTVVKETAKLIRSLIELDDGGQVATETGKIT